MGLLKSQVAESWAIDSESWPLEDQESAVQQIDQVLAVFEGCFGHELLMQRRVIMKHSLIEEPYTHALKDDIKPKNTFEVYLVNVINNPSRFYYQAAHEFSHVFTGCYPEMISFNWISECLCSAATFYVLKKLSSKSEYESIIESPLRQRRNWTSLKDYYCSNGDELGKDPYGQIDESTQTRPRNDMIATWFLEVIEQNPSGWKSIARMKDSDINLQNFANDAGDSTGAYLVLWYVQCESDCERLFAEAISGQIGYSFTLKDPPDHINC